MGTSGSTPSTTTTAAKGPRSFYSLSATRGDGTVVSMEDFRGKVVYATNVASK